MIEKVCKCLFKKKVTFNGENFINPIIIYKYIDKKTCPICLSPVCKHNMDVIFPFKCGHLICFECFNKWNQFCRNKKDKNLIKLIAHFAEEV